jgi:hypothetical protein
MTAKEILENIEMCICGSKGFRPMIGCFENTIEIICAKCGRTAKRKGELR